MARYRKNRNKNNTSINLFSFQDIISCVTGIMLCVTLLLIINLINSEFSDKIIRQRSIEKIRKKDLEAVKKLQINFKELSNDVSALEHSIQTMDIIPESVRLLSAAEINRQLREIELEKEVLLKSEVKLSEKLKSFIILSDKLTKKIEVARKGNLLLDKKVKAITSLLLKTKTDIGNTENKLKNLHSTPLEVSAKTTVNGLEPILGILEKEGIQLNLTDGSQISFKPQMGIIDSAVSGFSDYLSANSGNRVYFYFLIRPSGANYFFDLRELLSKYNFKYGAEPIEEHRRIIYKR